MVWIQQPNWQPVSNALHGGCSDASEMSHSRTITILGDILVYRIFIDNKEDSDKLSLIGSNSSFDELLLTYVKKGRHAMTTGTIETIKAGKHNNKNGARLNIIATSINIRRKSNQKAEEIRKVSFRHLCVASKKGKWPGVTYTNIRNPCWQ